MTISFILIRKSFFKSRHRQDVFKMYVCMSSRCFQDVFKKEVEVERLHVLEDNKLLRLSRL